MELDLGPEIAQFRAELRDWIAAEAPGALASLTDWNMPLTAGGRRGARLAAAQAHPAYAEWAAKLLARRLIWPQWPEEFGGIGFTWEHDAHLYFKRAKSSELFLGDAAPAQHVALRRCVRGTGRVAGGGSGDGGRQDREDPWNPVHRT